MVEMVISAVLDRFENGRAVLLSYEIGLEIGIPDEELKGTYKEGETVYLTLDKDGNLGISDY